MKFVKTVSALMISAALCSMNFMSVFAEEDSYLLRDLPINNESNMVDEETMSSTQSVNETMRWFTVTTSQGTAVYQSLGVSGYLYLNNNGVITGHSLYFTYPSSWYSLSTNITNYGSHVHITYTLSSIAGVSPSTISGSYDIYSNYINPRLITN